MKKMDKLITKTGQEVGCNIVGFIDGLYGKKIIIYTTIDNESELLASYYNLEGEKFILSEIVDDEEWYNIENEFKLIKEEMKTQKNN